MESIDALLPDDFAINLDELLGAEPTAVPTGEGGSFGNIFAEMFAA